MAKERLNVTVDPDVAEQVKERDDINVSGTVNEFLKRRLRGEGKSDAALSIEIDNHERKADKYEEEAEKHRRKAETKRQKLNERKQERREKLRAAAQQVDVAELKSRDEPYITTDETTLQQLANQADASVSELREVAIAQYETDTGDNQRHYQ